MTNQLTKPQIIKGHSPQMSVWLACQRDDTFRETLKMVGELNLQKNHPNCILIALSDWEALNQLAGGK